jgi:hypothetical protein
MQQIWLAGASGEVKGDAAVTYTARFEQQFGALGAPGGRRVEFLTVSELCAIPGLRNPGHYRLKSRSAEEAYPPGDRPRGEADLKSVSWHLRALTGRGNTLISPIIVYEVVAPDGSITPMLVDGMHRLVACHLAGAKACVEFLRFRARAGVRG